MRYSDFTVTDFTLDEYFQSWVFNTGDDSVRHFWDTWLVSHPEKGPDVAEARRLLQAIQFKNHSLHEDELAQLWNRIHQVDKSVPQRISSSKIGFYKIAAAAVLVGLLFMVYVFSNEKPYKQFHTAYGETKTFTLPDGSNVVLNANSNLTLMSDWNDETPREIWLDGEAFFSVVHTANDQLFKVNTQEGVTVEVLGTTFNVYNRTKETKVVLNSGQIRLNLPTAQTPEKILMKPGEMVEYKEQHYKKKSVDPELYTAWTDNKIILNHTSLSEMINMLKDNYGLEVKVVDPLLLKQTVSGSMPLGDREILLQQMAKAFQLTLEKEGQVIVAKELE
jgi:transmembrane sensor